MTTENLSENGFRWFLGVVEDRVDPKKLGRVRVRIHGFHGDRVRVPTTDLPWAPLIVMPTNASYKKKGISPTGIAVGSTVIGFFMDGNECNMPMILGTFAGTGDVSQLAAGEMSINKTIVGNEPASPFKAQYPYNKVYESEGGHVIEVDDTPNNERLHWYHKAGTYVEIDKDGQRVSKVVGDDYEVVVKNKNVYVAGNINVTVKGNVNIAVDGTYTIESKGNMTLKAPRIDLNP